ncbi:MAG: endolytic transglycosylase MltG [Anaerolineaceae bacterium]|nr:endolytic transglycosylase MltG [Anaerolineaceae bacterium]
MAGNRGGSKILGVFFLLFLCVSLTGVVWALQAIPQQAAREFGPADPRLTTFKRLSLSSQLLAQKNDLLEPLDRGAGKQSVAIEIGESPLAVAERLEGGRILRDSGIFLLYLVYAGLDKSIQAGEYQLSAAMSPVEIAHALQDATPTDVPFTILAGWRLEEIAAALPTSGLNIAPEEFLETARQPELSGLPPDWVHMNSLEGFLPPGSYILPRSTSVNELFGALTQRFQEELTPELINGFRNQGLDVYQAVTLASIIQREAIAAEEQPMIASVFFNRLNTGMSLDSDPTVQYSLGYYVEGKNWWKNPLSLDDLQVASPYNTYRNTGLPPGPICAPTVSALTAVAYPAQSPYYYFRTRCDDSKRHSFAVSFQEHLENACP